MPRSSQNCMYCKIGPALECSVAEAFVPKESFTDSSKPPLANSMVWQVTCCLAMSKALTCLKMMPTHFLYAHLRSQESLSAHKRESAFFTALTPICLKDKISSAPSSELQTFALTGTGGRGPCRSKPLVRSFLQASRVCSS